MTVPPRTVAERRKAALRRLEQDVDLWVATASRDGAPYLVPLSFLWDGAALVIATPAASVTGRNLAEGGRCRLGLGPTRDVVLVEATAEVLAQPDDDVLGAFAARTGFDPRADAAYRYFRLVPQRVQAWREENELAGRELMRGGDWLS